MSRVSKPELKASTQGVMQGLHNGIGRACGALLGGYMINAIGKFSSSYVSSKKELVRVSFVLLILAEHEGS